jgi:hypothetical protein
MVMEYDMAPERENDRKPPAPEGDMDSKGTAPEEKNTASKGTAPDEVSTASICTAPEFKQDTVRTAPEGDADRNGPAPDGGDDDCYMIQLPTALKTQIRVTVVNKRHMNNRFRTEENHYIKLDGGSDISVFKQMEAFSVIRHERQSIEFGLTVGDNKILEMHGLRHVGLLGKCIWAPT